MRAMIGRRGAAAAAAVCIGLATAGTTGPAAPAATAQQAVSAAGTWRVDIFVGATFSNTQYWRLADAGGTVTGDTATTATGAAYGTVSGTRAGNTVALTNPYNDGVYTATMSGTIAAGGTSASGTWSDTNGQSGTFTATLTTPPVTVGGPGPGPAAGTRPAAVAVLCNRGPNPGDAAVCTATVGDAGAPPRTTPTGSVRFAATAGSLTLGDTCTLVATPSSPGVASCSVTYQPPAGFGVGVAFPVTAVYLGDGSLAPAEGVHRVVWPGCIGTAATPCDGGVSLAFASTRPRLTGMRLPTTVGCDAGRVTAQQEPGIATGDLCNVTVSVGTTAKDAVDALGARAFTDGRAAAFAEGLEKADPVAAHEAGHLVQRRSDAARERAATDSARRVYRMSVRRVRLGLGASARTTLVMDRRGRAFVAGLRRAGAARLTVTVRMTIAATGGRAARSVVRRVSIRL